MLSTSLFDDSLAADKDEKEDETRREEVKRTKPMETIGTGEPSGDAVPARTTKVYRERWGAACHILSCSGINDAGILDYIKKRKYLMLTEVFMYLYLCLVFGYFICSLFCIFFCCLGPNLVALISRHKVTKPFFSLSHRAAFFLLSRPAHWPHHNLSYLTWQPSEALSCLT